MVESTVNQVGVDLANTSPALLTYVAGIGEKLLDLMGVAGVIQPEEMNAKIELLLECDCA